MSESIDVLVSQTYDELRVIAHRHLARKSGSDRNTLGTTALVNEAYLKLSASDHARPRDHNHFLAIAAVAMRHILIDHARAHAAAKRGAGLADLPIDTEALAVASQPECLLAINEALDRVAEIDPRLARVVELRFFGGLTEPEIADVLGVTTRTVQRDWVKARMLLRRELEAGAP
jgi:RNA polymerase sigma factor (TIGR02999 family)